MSFYIFNNRFIPIRVLWRYLRRFKPDTYNKLYPRSKDVEVCPPEPPSDIVYFCRPVIRKEK